MTLTMISLFSLAALASGAVERETESKGFRARIASEQWVDLRSGALKSGAELGFEREPSHPVVVVVSEGCSACAAWLKELSQCKTAAPVTVLAVGQARYAQALKKQLGWAKWILWARPGLERRLGIPATPYSSVLKAQPASQVAGGQVSGGFSSAGQRPEDQIREDQVVGRRPCQDLAPS